MQADAADSTQSGCFSALEYMSACSRSPNASGEVKPRGSQSLLNGYKGYENTKSLSGSIQAQCSRACVSSKVRPKQWQKNLTTKYSCMWAASLKHLKKICGQSVKNISFQAKFIPADYLDYLCKNFLFEAEIFFWLLQSGNDGTCGSSARTLFLALFYLNALFLMNVAALSLGGSNKLMWANFSLSSMFL